MKNNKSLIIWIIILFTTCLHSQPTKEGELVIIKPTQLRETPSHKGKLIYDLYPTLFIKNKLPTKKIIPGWTKVNSGFCTVSTKHDKCNSAIGYIPSESLAVYDTKLFKQFRPSKNIKFTNFNTKPKLKYVFEENGTFFHFNPMCGDGDGKCGRSILYIMHNLIWGKPIASGYIYKFYINEKGQICAPSPGMKKIYPCSKESIR